MLSAGVGRTGVFISLSIVLERMQYEGVVDVFQTVRTLRTQRPAMVQSEVTGVTPYVIATLFLRGIYSGKAENSPPPSKILPCFVDFFAVI